MQFIHHHRLVISILVGCRSSMTSLSACQLWILLFLSGFQHLLRDLFISVLYCLRNIRRYLWEYSLGIRVVWSLRFCDWGFRRTTWVSSWILCNSHQFWNQLGYQIILVLQNLGFFMLRIIGIGLYRSIGGFYGKFNLILGDRRCNLR